MQHGRAFFSLRGVPASGEAIATSIAVAIVAAAVVLVAFVLPAEYGSTRPDRQGARTHGDRCPDAHAEGEVMSIGGNEKYREVAMPDPGDPVPLPNPAVAQIKPDALRAPERRP